MTSIMQNLAKGVVRLKTDSETYTLENVTVQDNGLSFHCQNKKGVKLRKDIARAYIPEDLELERNGRGYLLQVRSSTFSGSRKNLENLQTIIAQQRE